MKNPRLAHDVKAWAADDSDAPYSLDWVCRVASEKDEKHEEKIVKTRKILFWRFNQITDDQWFSLMKTHEFAPRLITHDNNEELGLKWDCWRRLIVPEEQVFGGKYYYHQKKETMFNDEEEIDVPAIRDWFVDIEYIRLKTWPYEYGVKRSGELLGYLRERYKEHMIEYNEKIICNGKRRYVFKIPEKLRKNRVSKCGIIKENGGFFYELDDVA